MDAVSSRFDEGGRVRSVSVSGCDTQSDSAIFAGPAIANDLELHAIMLPRN